MSQYLRDVVVRTASRFLEKYIEGITAEDAQLNIGQGRLELPSARLKRDIVPPHLPLRLTNGQISLSVQVPWRRLGHEPVVFKVTDLAIELEPEGAPESQADAKDLRERWREDRRHAVKARAKELAEASDSNQQGDASMLARFTKRVLQNLEVHIDSSSLVLHDVDDSLALRSSLVLQTAKPPGDSILHRESVPDSSMTATTSGTLFKSFELKDVAVHLNKKGTQVPENTSRIIGPLSLRAKLSEVDQTMQLELELVNTALRGSLAQLPKLIAIAGRLKATAEDRTRVLPQPKRLFKRRSKTMRGADSESRPVESSQTIEEMDEDAQMDPQDSMMTEEVSSEPGEVEERETLDFNSVEYEELYGRFLVRTLRGEALTQEEQEILQEIEDAAPVPWLALRLQACKSQLAEKDRRSKSGSLLSRATSILSRGDSHISSQDAEEKVAMSEVWSMLRDLPEDEAPENIEVSACIPTVELVLQDAVDDQRPGARYSSGSFFGHLKADARGLTVRFRAKPQGTRREVSVEAELVSAHMKFADAPLIHLDVTEELQGDSEGFYDVQEAAVRLTIEAREETAGWVIDTKLQAPPQAPLAQEERGSGSARSVEARFDGRERSHSAASMRWPFKVHLAPWSIRRFLELYLATVSAWERRQLPCPESGGESGMTRSWTSFTHDDSPISPKDGRSRKTRFFTAAASLSPRTSASQEQNWRGTAMKAARESLPAVRFSANLCLVAPVLLWELPSGDIASFQLGQLRARSNTREAGMDDRTMPLEFDFEKDVEPAPLKDLAITAKLTQMCVTIEKSDQNWRSEGRPRSATNLSSTYYVFETSAIMACLVPQQDGMRTGFSAQKMLLRGGNQAWSFLGQLQPALDWALEPLSKLEQSTISSSKRERSDSWVKRSPGGGTRRARFVKSPGSSSAEDDVLSPGGKDSFFEYDSSSDDEKSRSPSAPGSPTHMHPASSMGHTASRTSSSCSEKIPMELSGFGYNRSGVRAVQVPCGAPDTFPDSDDLGASGDETDYDSEEEALRSFLGVKRRRERRTSIEEQLLSDPSLASRAPPKRKADPKRRATLAAEVPTPSSDSSSHGVLVNVKVDTFELQWGEDVNDVASLKFEQLGIKRHGEKTAGHVESMTLMIRLQDQDMPELPLITLKGGLAEGGLQVDVVATAPPKVAINSAPIAVHWRPECAKPILNVVQETKKAWSRGIQRVEQKIGSHCKGTIAKSWTRWREQKLALLKKEYKRKQKERKRDPNAIRDDFAWIVTKDDGTVEDDLPLESRLPKTQDKDGLALEVEVCLQKLSISFWAKPNSMSRGMWLAPAHEKPCVFTELKRVTLSARVFNSWILRGSATLQGFEVHLHDRRILAPRNMLTFENATGSGNDNNRADDLLEIGFFVSSRTLIAAKGAQLSLLYRQRDVDFLLAYAHAHVLDVLAELRDLDSPQQAPLFRQPSSGRRSFARYETCRDSNGEESPRTIFVPQVNPHRTNQPNVLYFLDVGCPVLFVPTFKAVLAQEGEIHNVACGGELGPSGDLKNITDSYTVMDLGRVQVWNRSPSAAKAEDNGKSTIELRFSGAKVKSTATGQLRVVASPTGKSGTQLTLSPGGKVDAASHGNYRMELMRCEVTQWLDMIAENVLYASYAPKPPDHWPQSERKVERHEGFKEAALQKLNEAKSRGFALTWRWEVLDIDTGFTPVAPISRLELRSGVFDFQTVPFEIRVQADACSVQDRRPGSRNAERTFIHCSSRGLSRVSSSGRSHMRTNSGGGAAPRRSTTHTPSFKFCYNRNKTEVRINEPVTNVLPQLYMDLQTYCLSIWRLCSWKLYPAQPRQAPELANSAAPAVPQRRVVDISIQQGAFRILTRYEDHLAEHLEFRGDLRIQLGLSDSTEFDINFSDGRIHRSLSPTLLCPAIQMRLSGPMTSTKSGAGSVLTHWTLNLDVPALQMQLTGLDLGILTRGFSELARRDSESVEPREEVELRDPEAVKVENENKMSIAATFNFTRVELLLADDQRGSRPQLSVAVRCPGLNLDFMSQKGRPSTWALACTREALVLTVLSFHPQLGVWEPVIPDWHLSLSYKQRPQPGRAALMRQVNVESNKVTTVVTTAFIHSMCWFAPLFLAHLNTTTPDESGFESPLSILNLSGMSCEVRSGNGHRFKVWPGSDAVPLDSSLIDQEPMSPARCGDRDRGTMSVWKDPQGMDSEHVEILANGCPRLTMQLVRESLMAADKLVCEVLVPHPSQRLLLLASAVRIENFTKFTLHVRFLDRLGITPVDVSTVNPVNMASVGRHLRFRTQDSDDDPAPYDEDRGTVTASHHQQFVANAVKSRDSVEVEPGQLLFAPFAAIHGTLAHPELQMQLRPANTDMGYEWCTANLGPGSATGQSIPLISSCNRTRGKQKIFLELDRRQHDGVMTMQIAVWTYSIANATPCTIECKFRHGNARTILMHSECPISGDAMEVQVRLSVSSGYTEWSRFIRLEALNETFIVTCSGVPVELGLRHDTARRRTVISAPLWFVDATGLRAQLSVGRLSAVRFGKDISLLPVTASNFDGEVALAVEGLAEKAKARIPVPGRPEMLTLPPHHDVVLRFERVSAAETFGTQCGLVSLLPRFVLFNQMKRTAVVFRQEATNSASESSVKVNPNGKAMFFFRPTDRKRLEFKPEGCQTWSASFELADHTLGAYAIATDHGPACLKISRDGGVFSASVDSEGCHEVRNEHKSLIVEVRPDGEYDAAVVARPGDTRNFASRNPFTKGSTAVLHLTRLGGNQKDVLQVERVQINLCRRERLELRVGGLPVTVTIATARRVAVVTVRPRAWHEVTVERVDYCIRLKTVAFSLVGERPRCERFNVRLDEMELQVEQEQDEDMRAMSLSVGALQVDRLHPTPDVLLASVRPPFLSGRILREDCNSSHVLLNQGEISLGYLEVNIVDETVNQIAIFVSEAIPQPPGLQLREIQNRACDPYPNSCKGPPNLPTTLVLRSLMVGQLRLRVWARLSIFNSFLPRLIYSLTRITGLGASELRLDGVDFCVPPLRFFQYSCLFGRPDPPFAGSARGLLGRIAEKYIPELIKCWQSVVSNSNMLFGGVITRQFWFPKKRKASSTYGGLCRITKNRVEHFE